MAEEKENLFEKLWKSGIHVTKTRFQGDVNNSDQEPEGEFNEESLKSSRRVEMRLVPQGLLCLHKKKYFMVPLPHIKQMFFK